MLITSILLTTPEGFICIIRIISLPNIIIVIFSFQLFKLFIIILKFIVFVLSFEEIYFVND